MKPVRTAVVGCGAISKAYLDPLHAHFSHLIELVACNDLVPDVARRAAADYGIPHSCSAGEIYADPAVELVLNLTVPRAHHAVTMDALRAGKHVFTEKPLGVNLREALEIVAAAHAGELQVAGAADTFLGAGLQTVRRLLDDGAVGIPVAATAFVGLRPASARYYQPGVGPLLDMGPYHLTALVALFGPVRAVTAFTQIPLAEHTIFDRPKNQEISFSVATPSNIGAVLAFEGGKHATLTATAESSPYTSHLAIAGTEGVLAANDPNFYSGALSLLDADRAVREIRPVGYGESGRGLGVAEMAHAIRHGRPALAAADLLLHVTEVMEAIFESGRTGRAVATRHPCLRPEPFDIATLDT